MKQASPIPLKHEKHFANNKKKWHELLWVMALFYSSANAPTTFKWERRKLSKSARDSFGITFEAIWKIKSFCERLLFVVSFGILNRFEVRNWRTVAVNHRNHRRILSLTNFAIRSQIRVYSIQKLIEVESVWVCEWSDALTNTGVFFYFISTFADYGTIASEFSFGSIHCSTAGVNSFRSNHFEKRVVWIQTIC